MEQPKPKSKLEKPLKIIGGATVVLVYLGIGYQYYNISARNIELESLLIYTDHERKEIELDRDNIRTLLEQEQKKNGTYEDKLDTITSKAHNLEKILNTDKELLQKYSKVYFLNEHYNPSSLSEIPSTLLTPNSKKLEIHEQVLPYLKDMIKASQDANNPIQVVSAYRSYTAQTSLKTAYKSVFGKGANTFSADQGYSEHQLGTTIDLTTPILKSTFVAFEKTPAFKWLTENAHEYGFTLSYPKNNKYYTYEPWHWRFVGVDLATKLHKENKYFYDLDQRTIDEYLLNIFD
jgi:zinc D-Ala-D-Ala carboxypeptidase